VSLLRFRTPRLIGIAVNKGTSVMLVVANDLVNLDELIYLAFQILPLNLHKCYPNIEHRAKFNKTFKSTFL
jgi:hypothetical protein